MTKPLVDRIPFAKILITLAVVFMVALGLCGLTARSALQPHTVPTGLDHFLKQTVGYDVLAMVLSIVGIVIIAVVWIIMTVISRARRKE
jgi:cellobiose-specific phosphotransferase system component IIC